MIKTFIRTVRRVFNQLCAIMTNLYLDAEWYLNQRIFLIGYALENSRTEEINVQQLFKRDMFPKDIRQILNQCSGYIYVYGPDVGMIEKRFEIPVREKFTCINFLKVVKQLVPGLSSYKLANIEQHFGFFRKADKYKKNIFDIYRDWNHPDLRKIVLEYNYEDVYYLAKLKQIIFDKYKPSREWLESIALSSKRMVA